MRRQLVSEYDVCLNEVHGFAGRHAMTAMLRRPGSSRGVTSMRGGNPLSRLSVSGLDVSSIGGGTGVPKVLVLALVAASTDETVTRLRHRGEDGLARMQ